MVRTSSSERYENLSHEGTYDTTNEGWSGSSTNCPSSAFRMWHSSLSRCDSVSVMSSRASTSARIRESAASTIDPSAS